MHTWIELLNNDDYIGIKKHLKNGGDLSETNETGESVLACSIKARCGTDTIMLLINNGADIFDFDEEGVGIFDMAITYGNIDIVKYLLEQEINVNTTNRKSRFTPLMAAVCYGRLEIVKILLDNGAKQRAQDIKGFTAVDFARKMNKKSILKILEIDENIPANTGYAR